MAGRAAAYDALDSLDPWSVDDFLVAHRLLTAGLITESGVFRSVEVDIVNAHDEVIHTGSPLATSATWERVSSLPSIAVEECTAPSRLVRRNSRER